MPKRGRFIDIQATPESKETMEMLNRNWQKRFAKFQEQFVRECAGFVATNVQDRIPSDSANRVYKNSISISRVSGLGSGEVGYAVHSKSKTRKEKVIDSQGTVVYVRAKRRMKKISAGIQVLVDFSPWTLSTLPFTPNKTDANIVFRKVTEREVKSVEKLRKRDRKRWRLRLQQEGIRTKKSGSPLAGNNKQVRGIPDRAFTALRLELGQGNVKPKPHWRPAIWDLKRIRFRQMMKDRSFKRGLTDPGYKGWMRWPTKTASRVSAKVAKSFAPFQKKLGIKVTR